MHVQTVYNINSMHLEKKMKGEFSAKAFMKGARWHFVLICFLGDDVNGIFDLSFLSFCLCVIITA